MNRNQAVIDIMGKVKDDDIVITPCGYISREVYWVKDRPLNFYMMGSMGNELALGIGMAMNTWRFVHIISGDGGVLMSGSTNLLFDHLKISNAYHYILDDRKFSSTGGQPTIGIWKYGYRCDVIKIKDSCPVPSRIPLKPTDIKERFYEAVHQPKQQEKS